MKRKSCSLTVANSPRGGLPNKYDGDDNGHDNKLIFNLKKGKSEVMLFGTGKRLNLLHGCQVKLSVNGAPINTTTCYKYLGVHLDPTLNFETHFQKIYKAAAGRVNLFTAHPFQHRFFQCSMNLPVNDYANIYVLWLY